MIKLGAGLMKYRSYITGRGVSLHHSIETSPGNHPLSYPMDTEGSFPRSKTGAAWIWPLSSICYQDKNMWSYTYTLPYIYMLWCLIQHRVSFMFYYRH
jgi:hypothetical protein